MSTLSDLIEQQEETNLRLDEIDNRFLEFFKMVRADKLDMLEMTREMQVGSSIAPVVNNITPASEGSPANLGILLGGLAATIGTAIGAIQGQITAVRTFAKILTPRFIEKKFVGIIDSFRAGISKSVDLLKKGITERIAAIRTTISSGLEKIKSFFTLDDSSIAGKIFRRLGENFNNFIKPFKEAGTVIRELSSGPGQKISDFFKTIKSYLSAFGNSVGKIAGMVGKLFAPIAIITTFFDTITGAMKGFTEEEGTFWEKTWAGIKGGFVSFVESLILKPLDLVKDIISWISDKLGFENFSKILDSFTFQDTFFKFPQAVMAGGAAALKAILPGGDSPVEAFSKTYTRIMESDGNVQPEISGNSTPSVAKTSAIEKRTLENNSSSNQVVVVNNNTNAPTTVSNQTNMMNGDLPSPIMSNGSRADAYSPA